MLPGGATTKLKSEREVAKEKYSQQRTEHGTVNAAQKECVTRNFREKQEQKQKPRKPEQKNQDGDSTA